MLPGLLVTSPGSGADHWIAPTFENYGTVSFDRDFIRQNIGFGTAVADRFNGRIRFAQAWDERIESPVTSIQPETSLNLELWEGFVPVAYQDEMWPLMKYLWRELGGTTQRIGTLDKIAAMISDWIGAHVVPTSEHRPRSERWARMWREIGVRAAHNEGWLTDDEAWRLLND